MCARAACGARGIDVASLMLPWRYPLRLRRRLPRVSPRHCGRKGTESRQGSVWNECKTREEDVVDVHRMQTWWGWGREQGQSWFWQEEMMRIKKEGRDEDGLFEGTAINGGEL